MKAKNLFFGALTCLAFAACSNDDEPTVNGGQEEGKGQYVSINIMTPAETRATAGNFVAGTDKENTIDANDVILAFYKGEELLVAKGPENMTWTSKDQSTPAVEKISNAVVYIVPKKTANFTDATEGYPNRVVAILNASQCGLSASMMEDAKTNYSYTKLQEIIGNYDLTSEKNKFLMTNSVWKENVGYTSITSDNYRPTAELAAAAPIEIYVERVLAKVTVKMSANLANGSSITATDATFSDGTEATITPKIIGYHLASTANKSNLIKKIGNWSWTDWTWNDPDNCRSYWAIMPAGMTEEDFTFRKYSDNEDAFTYTVVDDVTTKTANEVTFYCQENTSTDANNLTQLVVLAEHQVDGVSLNSFIKLGAVYYTPENYIKYMANILSGIYKSSASTWDWTEKIEIAKYDEVNTSAGKPWQIVAQVKSDLDADDLASISRRDEQDLGEQTILENVNEALANENYVAKMWGSCRAYYFVDIEHFGTEETGTDVGIVRNHAYELTLNSLQGLGTPVYDPETNPTDDPDDIPDPEDEDPIDPENPDEDETYISARINILKWKIVTQDVELGQ